MPARWTRRLLLAAPALLATPGPAAAQHPSGVLARVLETRILRLGVWLNTPPLGIRSDTGEPDGIDVELGRRLAAAMDVRLQVVPLDGRERFAAVMRGRVDILGSISVVPQTLLRLAFAAPHGDLCVVMVTRPGLGIRSIADLAGRRIALPAGMFITDFVHTRLPEGAEVYAYADQAECLDALLAAEVDATPALDWNINALLIQDPASALEVAFRLGIWRHGFAVNQGEHDMLRLVNTFLELARTDGTLADVRQTYAGTALTMCTAPP